MKEIVVGDLKIIYYHKKKEVEIRMINERDGVTFIHYMDYDDWKEMALNY